MLFDRALLAFTDFAPDGLLPAAGQDGPAPGAIAGVDPVDSQNRLSGEFRVVDGPFDFPIPSLVLGTGLGPIPKIPIIMPACAPDGDNHEQFYEASASPAYHVVATEQGHLDMLNDDHSGCGIACSVCTEGEDDEAMRLLAAGLLAAFFRASLQGDETAFDYLTDPADAPTPVTMEHR